MDQKKTINEFFDPEILVKMKSLGLVPPRTIKDILRLEQEIKCHPLKKPSKLEDPNSFLEHEPRIRSLFLSNSILKEYEQNLAHAARNGDLIPDHIRQKMIEDKNKSKKPNGK